jgi:hypothetical protein
MFSFLRPLASALSSAVFGGVLCSVFPVPEASAIELRDFEAFERGHWIAGSVPFVLYSPSTAEVRGVYGRLQGEEAGRRSFNSTKHSLRVEGEGECLGFYTRDTQQKLGEVDLLPSPFPGTLMLQARVNADDPIEKLAHEKAALLIAVAVLQKTPEVLPPDVEAVGVWITGQEEIRKIWQGTPPPKGTLRYALEKNGFVSRLTHEERTDYLKHPICRLMRRPTTNGWQDQGFETVDTLLTHFEASPDRVEGSPDRWGDNRSPYFLFLNRDVPGAPSAGGASQKVAQPSPALRLTGGGASAEAGSASSTKAP